MSERIHALAQSLLGKASVEECDPEEIRELTDRYPYFSPAQFLLLEKLKQANSSEYTAQLQKSVLYYHNPLEFEHFISSNRFYTELDFDDTDLPPTDNYPEEENNLQVEASLESETGIEAGKETNYVTGDPITIAIEKVVTQEEQSIDSSAPTSNLVFEPYHTIDYFASQGIKLSQEDVPRDKFGKQLKSFTEWLKTMKRIPASEISKSVDATTETKVQHLAEDSVHDADIITEAMAEVWVKQGNIEKAMETYNKLSLLNPSKKAYFASQIENLKRF